MKRFIEKDDTVVDKLTGLMWTKEAALSEFPMAWQEGLDAIQALNRSRLFGYNDWKLPNRRELLSLVSHDYINPSLPLEHPFVHVFTGYYWTSTSCSRSPNQAWYIHFGGARVFKGMKHRSYMVWPVRKANDYEITLFQTGQQHCYDEKGKMIPCHGTGQDGALRSGLSWINPRFIESDDTVLDRLTELIWIKNANLTVHAIDWETAFDVVKGMNRGKKYGYNDWRIPNILELESLTDMGHHSPALPAGSPFEGVQEYYWASTTSKYDNRYAWVLYLKDGGLGVGYKPLPEFFIWPVRGRKTGHKKMA